MMNGMRNAWEHCDALDKERLPQPYRRPPLATLAVICGVVAAAVALSTQTVLDALQFQLTEVLITRAEWALSFCAFVSVASATWILWYRRTHT
jgi:hypothetical protein